MNLSRHQAQSLHAKLIEHFRTGKTLSLAHRISALEKLKSNIISNQESILKALQADFGKPQLEAFVSEVGFILEEINRTVADLPVWMKPQKVCTPLMLFPAQSALHYEPRGVCLILAPWNYPFQLLLSPLVGALAAGNCVCVKPSELAPQTSKIIADLIAKTFPPEQVVCVQGGVEETTQLLELRWDHIFFTGSTPVGKIVMKAAAEFLTPVTLELGGKSPCIIDRGVPLERSMKRIVWAKLFNAGQTCVAPDYLFVPKELQAQCVDLFARYVKEFYGDEPSQSSHYARIVNDRHFARLKNLLSGGTILTGGHSNSNTRYMAPTILSPHSMSEPLMTDEIFGPLLPILTYSDIQEAFDFVLEREKPLAFYLFTQNSAVERHALETISSGGACINDAIMHLSNPHLPFGGVGNSGMGAYHGHYSFETFSHRKGVLKNSLRFEIEMRYPPYSENQLRRIQFFQGSKI